MDLQFLFIVFVSATQCNTANGLAARFLREYFADKFIHQIVVFACCNFFERVEFSRQLMLSDTELSYVSISENINIRKTLAVNYYKLGIVLDLDCTNSEIIFDKFQKERLPYNESYFWLAISKDPTPPMDILRKLPLTVETEFTLVLDHNKIYLLYDVYNPSYRHGGRLNVTYMGVWNSVDGLSVQLTQYKYKRRADFEGLHLNFSIALSNPPVPDLMTYISNPINRHLDTMHRFNYALVLQLRDYYNFTMNLMRSETWGYLVNGTFNGLLGDMINGLVDVGATPLQFKPERIDVAEYTVQTFVARPTFFFRHPKKISVGNGFLRPFREEVWWTIVAVGLVYWLILWLTIKLELHCSKRMACCTMDSHPVFETGLICVAAISQQGLTDSPRFYSSRVVFLFLFFWGLLLYQFYSASIVGSLLAEPPRFINNLEDLLYSNLAIGIEDIAYNYDFFATTSDPVALELYKQKVAPNKNRKQAAFYNHKDGLRRVKEGGFAFHTDINTAYKIIAVPQVPVTPYPDTFSEDEICDLMEVQLFPAKHVATVTSKHSPFKKMVTYGLRQILEHGLAERLLHVWQDRRPTCPKSHSSTPVPVSLGEFLPAILLLLMGLMMAVAVLGVENFFTRYSSAQVVKMTLYIALLLLILLKHTITDQVLVQFAKDYFSEKSIREIVVFGCFDHYESINFTREMMLRDTSISYISVTANLNIQSILALTYSRIGIILHLDCQMDADVFYQFSSNQLLFNESYYWLMISMGQIIPKEQLSILSLTVAAEVTVALRLNDTFQLYDIYNPSYRHGGRLNITFMGYWNPEDGLHLEFTQYKYKRRGNFNGLSLNLSIVIVENSTMDFMKYISTPVDTHLDSMSRYGYAVTEHLRDFYNFTINLSRATSWGYMRNGSYNGIIGLMQNGLVDIAVSPMHIKKNRFGILEGSVETWICRPYFIFRHPKSSNVGNRYLVPFTDEVWWATLIVAIICWLLLWLTVKVELHYTRRMSSNSLESQPFTETFLTSLGAVAQQGLSDAPNLHSGRVVFITVFVWGLLLYQFYSASVVGSLLADPPRYINTLQDLYDSGMPLGIEDIPYNYNFFATTTDRLALKLHKNRIASAGGKNKSYFHAEEGLRRVQKGNFAFFCDVATAYKIITDTFSEEEICDLAEIFMYPPFRLVAGTSTKSNIRKMVSYGMRHIVEHGLSIRQQRIWHAKRPECVESHSAMPVPVSLPEFIPAIFLLLIGVSAAFIAMITEKYIYWCIRRKDFRRLDGVYRNYLKQSPQKYRRTSKMYI